MSRPDEERRAQLYWQQVRAREAHRLQIARRQLGDPEVRKRLETDWAPFRDYLHQERTDRGE